MTHIINLISILLLWAHITVIIPIYSMNISKINKIQTINSYNLEIMSIQKITLLTPERIYNIAINHFSLQSILDSLHTCIIPPM